MQRKTGQTAAKAHRMIGKASRSAGGHKADLDKAREPVRRAPWCWDFAPGLKITSFYG
jgi:hypothetical protein